MALTAEAFSSGRVARSAAKTFLRACAVGAAQHHKNAHHTHKLLVEKRQARARTSTPVS